MEYAELHDEVDTVLAAVMRGEEKAEEDPASEDGGARLTCSRSELTLYIDVSFGMKIVRPGKPPVDS